MSRWTSIVITAVVLVASAGIAWGVMTSRVEAAEVRLNQHGIEIQRHDRELREIRDAQKDSQWNVWSLCSHAGAPDCRKPGEK